MNYASRYALTSIDDIKKVVHGVLNGVEKYMPLTEERKYNIALVINELLVNSFEHASPSKKAPVIFKATMKNGCLSICITDRGTGFAHDSMCSHMPEDEETLLRERGRGLTLVRALCQDIRYNGLGNSVEVRIAL